MGVRLEHGTGSNASLPVQMGKTHLVPLTDAIALTAADVSLAHGIAMADAIVYATAMTEKAKVLTSDEDLADLPGVTYLKKH